MKNGKILIVDDEAEHREVLETILIGEGFQTAVAESSCRALDMMELSTYELVLADLIMPEMDGLELLRQIRRRHPDTNVIIITGYGTVETAVSAMREGAYSYFIKGHDPEELLIEIEKAFQVARLRHDNEILKDAAGGQTFISETKSPAFIRVLEMAKKASQSNVNILLLGESGVGKEVLARFIHNNSDRSERYLMAVNCHAFSASLLESELFGHEKGAFTGALHRRKGRFEAAHGGTLFLDEIGDIPMGIQRKLLRVLETRQIERMGSNKTIDVDFRLITASNIDLLTQVNNSNFRSDLYYRISTMPLEIPLLKERKEDLPTLVDFFFTLSQKELKKPIRNVENGVKRFLHHYTYPGNVRELKNIIERLVVLSENGIVRTQDLPDPSGGQIRQETPDQIRPLKEIRSQTEADHISHAMAVCSYNMTETARRLKISRRQLFNKIHAYGLK